MKFISNFFKGLIIGAGAIAPGVSGGAIAVIFNLYENLMGAIANIFKDFKKNLFYLIPIGMGGAIGVVGFSRIIKYLFATYNAEVKYLFIGLMIGTLPLVFKQANKKGYRSSYFLFLIVTLIITLGFAYLNNAVVEGNVASSRSFIELALYGLIIGFGTIVPGISASFILMYLGSYDVILDAIGNINIIVLIPVGVGFALSIFVFAKLIHLLFEKTYGYTYYCILGLVIGSIIPIFPGFALNLKYIICVFLLVLGFCLSYYLSKFSKDNE